MTCPQNVNADKIYWYVILRLPLNQQTFLACVTRHASSLKEKKKSLVCQRSPRCRVDFPALRPGNTMLTSCQGFQSWGKTHIYTLGHILAKYLYASIHVGFKCCWLFDLKPILPYHISRAHLVLMLLWGGFIPPTDGEILSSRLWNPGTLLVTVWSTLACMFPTIQNVITRLSSLI